MLNPLTPASGHTSGSSRPRPAERVLRYLESEFDRHDVEPGTRIRLPSVRELAERLGVSNGTVQTVFQRLGQEGRLVSEIGSGTYFIARALPRKVARIGVNISSPGSSSPTNWTCQIYGGILHGVLHASLPVVLQPLPKGGPDGEPADDELPNLAKTLDGLILFPTFKTTRLRTFFAGQALPVVHLNPPDEGVTADFVSPDYFGASRRLGAAWRECGRRRIAVVTAPGMRDSVSVRLRVAGLISGLEEDLGGRAEVRIQVAENGEPDSGALAMERLLASGYEPDAVYCAGDDLARGVLAVLLRAGRAVPGDVSLVGGNGMNRQLADGRELTVMEQPLTLMGEELIRMMVEKVRNPRRTLPGKYLAAKFCGGSTTTEAENALIFSEAESGDVRRNCVADYLLNS